MPKTILTTVQAALQQAHSLTPLHHIVVAISGGADSTALALLLHHILPSTSLTLAHILHSLPEAESPNDSSAIHSLASSIGASVHEQTVDVRAAMATSNESLEMAARRLRHQALQSIALSLHADAIALGHNADDQVETMLLRLARGTSAAGLAAMPLWTPPTPSRIGLLRPLLQCSRADLRSWLQSQHIPWQEDPTNAIPDVLRNRLRLSVLPALYDALGPQARDGFLRTASLLQAEESAWLQPAVNTAAATCYTPATHTFSLPHLLPLPAPLRQRLLLQAALHAGIPPAALSSDKIRALDAFASAPSQGTASLDLGNHIQAIRSYHSLHFAPSTPPPPTPSLLSITPDHGFHPTPHSNPLSRPQHAWLSKTLLPDPSALTLRFIQPGDRIHLFQHSGHSKLSDLLINAKIPRHLRPSIEVVALHSRILWLPGFSIDPTYAVESHSAPSWHLSLTSQTQP